MPTSDKREGERERERATLKTAMTRERIYSRLSFKHTFTQTGPPVLQLAQALHMSIRLLAQFKFCLRVYI